MRSRVVFADGAVKASYEKLKNGTSEDKRLLGHLERAFDMGSTGHKLQGGQSTAVRISISKHSGSPGLTCHPWRELSDQASGLSSGAGNFMAPARAWASW